MSFETKLSRMVHRSADDGDRGGDGRRRRLGTFVRKRNRIVRRRKSSRIAGRRRAVTALLKLRKLLVYDMRYLKGENAELKEVVVGMK